MSDLVQFPYNLQVKVRLLAADLQQKGRTARHREISLAAGRLHETMRINGAERWQAVQVEDGFRAAVLDRLNELDGMCGKLTRGRRKANPFAGKLELVVDRRLDAAPWYLVANPAYVPSLEYAYLEGAEGPQFFTDKEFDIDGVQIKVSVDFGAGWIDHRGWHRNPGQ